jgi:hypothetical protein
MGLTVDTVVRSFVIWFPLDVLDSRITTFRREGSRRWSEEWDLFTRQIR